VHWSRRLRRASILACALVVGGVAAHANDALDFWRQEYSREGGRSDQPPGGRAEPWPSERSDSWQGGRPDSARPSVRFTVRPRRNDSGEARYAGERHYCVRTCDGFYFPLSARGSASKAEMCRVLCPAAPTEVYRLSGGADSIEDAVSERGRSYASLPTALAYRKALKPGCACAASGATRMSVPITQDPTLARGDIVVTPKGVHVFAGNGAFPHRDRDFVHYRSYRGLSRELMTMLSLIDRPFRAAELKQTLDMPRAPAAAGGAGGAKSVRIGGNEAL
jgi:hypothetical protein